MSAIFLVKVLSVIAEIRIDPGEVHKRPQGPTSVSSIVIGFTEKIIPHTCDVNTKTTYFAAIYLHFIKGGRR